MKKGEKQTRISWRADRMVRYLKERGAWRRKLSDSHNSVPWPEIEDLWNQPGRNQPQRLELQRVQWLDAIRKGNNEFVVVEDGPGGGVYLGPSDDVARTLIMRLQQQLGAAYNTIGLLAVFVESDRGKAESMLNYWYENPVRGIDPSTILRASKMFEIKLAQGLARLLRGSNGKNS